MIFIFHDKIFFSDDKDVEALRAFVEEHNNKEFDEKYGDMLKIIKDDAFTQSIQDRHAPGRFAFAAPLLSMQTLHVD